MNKPLVATLTLVGILALVGGANSASVVDSTPEQFQLERILAKIDENHQEIKSYLDLIVEKFNITLNITVQEELVTADNATEVAPEEEVLAPEEIMEVEEPPEEIQEPEALDPSTREAIQEAYPRCSKASNFVEDGRLNSVISLASSPRLSHLSLPALYSAILDAILTPSPLICTQDYVRLAYKVFRYKKSSSLLAGRKEEWAWLKARFQPRIFDLFEARAWKIMSVGKPGFGLFATTVELPGVPEYSCLVVKRIFDNSNAVKFRLSSSKTDGSSFRISSVLTGTSYQLFHLCRGSNCDEEDSKLVILPNRDFVLGNNASTPLEFRIAQVSYGRMAAVASHAEGFWGLPFVMRAGTFTFREAGISRDEYPNYLFFLA